MSLVVTWMLTCDSCQKVIETRAQECTDSLTLPDRNGMMKMDLCESCMDRARYAVREALSIPQPSQPRIIN